MKGEFDINNNIVKLCLKAERYKEQKEFSKAEEILLQAWGEVNTDFEKFITAYYMARFKADTLEKLQWLKKSIDYALKVNTNATRSSLTLLYLTQAQCYMDIQDSQSAKESFEKSNFYKYDILDQGPFYHGTRADLKIGDFLEAGHNSNYRPEIIMNHIYFTAKKDGAGLAAALATTKAKQRVYIVEPTGDFENDPNVTDKKFPGNLTRSYRSKFPLKVVGEISDWNRLTDKEIQIWQEKLKTNKGEIIN